MEGVGFVGAPGGIRRKDGNEKEMKVTRRRSAQRRWVSPPVAVHSLQQFGGYSGVADAGLTPKEVVDGVSPARNVVKVQVHTPLGIVLAELGGGVYVAAVKPGGNVDKLDGKVRVGDRILGTSATFGNGTWPALSLDRVISAMKTRYGGEVTLLLERTGLTDDIYAEEDAQKELEQTGSGVRVDADARELEQQVRNALRSFGGLRGAGLPAINTLAALLVRSATLFKQYGKKRGQTAIIDSLYERLQRAQVPLDTKIFNLAMSAYVGTGNPGRALEIFEEIPTPNTACYTTLMKAFSKLNRLEDMNRTKIDMEESGVLLSARTYNTLLSAYSSRGRLDKVETLFKEMTVRHLIPDIVTWNIRMNAHAKAKTGTARVNKVFALFDEMKAHKLMPSKITFTTLLGACVSSGDLERAEVVLDEMKAAGVSPDTFTYNKLIEGYGDRLLYENALKALAVLEEHDELQPDKFSYGLSIRACCAAGQVEIAGSVLERMKTRGFKPEPQVYVTLLRSYAKTGDTTNAFNLLKEMQDENVNPDLRAMSALMHACVESDNGTLALSVYSKMMHLRMVPDIVTYTTLIRAHGKRREALKAVSVFNTMKKSNVSPNTTTYNALIEIAMDVKDPELALSVLREMNETKSVSVNRRTYELLFNPSTFDDSHAEYLKFLKNVLDVLQETNKYGNGQLYCELLKACMQASEYSLAETIVQNRKAGVFKLSSKDQREAYATEKKIDVINRREGSMPVMKERRRSRA